MKPFNKRDNLKIMGTVEKTLLALPGVRSIEQVPVTYDPHLNCLVLFVEPMIVNSVKGSVLEAFKETGTIIFSTGDFWLNHPQVPGLFMVYQGGIQIYLHVVVSPFNRESNEFMASPEYIIPLHKEHAVLAYTEALLAGLRHLYSGAVLGAQNAFYRCIEALKLLLAEHYQCKLAHWSTMTECMPREFVVLIEEITSTLHPLELPNHFVQLTNVVLHLIDQWPAEALSKVQLLGLIQGRAWMEEGLVFRKQYMAQAPWRELFNTLSKSIFELDFSPWYDSGGWNTNYQPYTFFHNQQAIANVSLSTMTLLIEGEEIPSIQIGTVMTREAWRRKGLSYALFLSVFADYPPDQYLYFLAADEMAIPLYESLGFVPWTQTQYWVDCVPTVNEPQIPFSSANLSQEALAELHQTCSPVSHHLSCTDDSSILRFYLTMGLELDVYELQDGIYAILQTGTFTEDDGVKEHVKHELVAYRFFVPTDQVFDYNTLINVAKDSGFSRVRFLFTPDGSSEPLVSLKSEEDVSASWMVHSGYSKLFPKTAHFPSISKT